MVCVTNLRNFVVRATNLRGFSTSRLRHLKVWGSDLDAKLQVNYPRNHRMFRAITKMMLDSSATPEPPRAIINVLPETDHEDDGSYSSGGWKSEDGKLSYGYSSFRGRRASMEDFYDVKISKIDGQTVSLFGIFDGHGGSRAAEYLKEHLFENLMMHPQFMTDTKLAISETYQRTDSDFLDAERNTFRDDGSTASTAVLVGNHLYVANVGDSRAVISKAGRAIALSDDHKPNRSDERKRIENAGGVVLWAGTWRVGGILAMSRAFGNRLLKQFVVAEPEIQFMSSLTLHQQMHTLFISSGARGGSDGFTARQFDFSSDRVVEIHLSCWCKYFCPDFATSKVLPSEQRNKICRDVVLLYNNMRREQEVNEELELLVLASDGLWDVVPNEDAISLARMEEGPEAAARKLTEAAFSRGSADNITCIVVRFHHDKSDADSSLTVD